MIPLVKLLPFVDGDLCRRFLPFPCLLSGGGFGSSYTHPSLVRFEPVLFDLSLGFPPPLWMFQIFVVEKLVLAAGGTPPGTKVEKNADEFFGDSIEQPLEVV